MSCEFAHLDGGYWSDPRNAQDYCDHCEELTANYCYRHSNTVCEDCEEKHLSDIEEEKRRKQKRPQ